MTLLAIGFIVGSAMCAALWIALLVLDAVARDMRETQISVMAEKTDMISEVRNGK